MSVHVSSWCWRHSKAKGIDRLILVSLADMADDDGENVYPSYATLAKRCGGISIKTVQRSIQRLSELGEIAVELHGGPAREGRTNQRSNRYSFPAYQTHEKCGHSDLSSKRSSGEARTSEARSQDISGGSQDTAVSSYPSFDPPSSDSSSSEPTHPADADAPPTLTPPPPVQAGVEPPLEPNVPDNRASAPVETTKLRADDLDGEGIVVDLFGSDTPPPRSRKPKPDTTTRDLNAGDVVAAWAETYQKATGVKPTGNRRGQVGKEAKQLIESGNDVARLVEAARETGRQGWWSLERQLTAVARVNWHRPAAVGGVRNFTSPADQSVYDEVW